MLTTSSNYDSLGHLNNLALASAMNNAHIH